MRWSFPSGTIRTSVSSSATSEASRSMAWAIPMSRSGRSGSTTRDDFGRIAMRLLVVEDDHQVASLLAQALTGEGHEVIIARDGEEALALLAHQRPDGVLLDVTLGELSGVDVLRCVRQTDQQLPVVIITGKASAKQLAEARRLGVSGVIQKPHVLKNLEETLRAVAES